MSGLSGEDRARLEGLLDYLQRTEDHPQAKADVDVFARALALIDQYEKALERIAALDGDYPDDYCEIARAALEPAHGEQEFDYEGEDGR